MTEHHAAPPTTRPCGPAAPALRLGLVGGSGGVGTSTVVAACAARAARAGRSVAAVDGHRFGGGLDLALGLDDAPGWRWEDLTGARGEHDGDRLREGLPGADRVVALAWGRAFRTAPVIDPRPVVGALARSVDLVLLDLPRPDVEAAAAWSQCCDERLLVVAPGVTRFAAAAVLVEAVAPTGIVLARWSGPRRDHDAELLESALGCPVVAQVPADSRVAADLAAGRPLGRCGALGAAADALLARVLTTARVA